MKHTKQIDVKFKRIWFGITQRVGKNKYYKDVKNLWLNLDEFYIDMYQSYCEHILNNGINETTIERIDVYGDYCKENCRWATYKEQASNRKNSRFLTYNGETKTFSEWARYLNITRQALEKRVNSGWSVEKIVTRKKLEGTKRDSLILLEKVINDVLHSKYGTKHRAELLMDLKRLKFMI